jgi:hypothetical protein
VNPEPRLTSSLTSYRATGNTLSFTCYENEAERAQAISRVPEYVGDASSTSLARPWAHSQIIANKCYTAQSDKHGSLIGTAFVVRDMMRIVDALDEDGMLRFWGNARPHSDIRFKPKKTDICGTTDRHLIWFYSWRHRCCYVP